MLQRGLALLAVVALLVAGLIVGGARELPLVASGLIETEEVRVGSRVGGRVQEVRVREGDRVEAGTVLVTLEPYDLRERLAQAKAELMAHRANLARLEAGARPEEKAEAAARRDEAAAFLAEQEAGARKQEVEVARAALALAQAELELAASERERVTALVQQGAARQDQLDRASSQHEVAQAQLTARKQELALVQEGVRAERIAQAKARLRAAEAAAALVEAGPREEDKERARREVEAAEARVAVLERSLGELEIKAPGPAIVAALDLYPGDLVAANSPVVALSSEHRVWVRAYIPSPLLPRVQEGTRLPVRVDGVAQELTGRVTFISREAEFVPQNVQTPDERQKQVFRVEVTLEEPGKVRPGMSADVDLERAASP